MNVVLMIFDSLRQDHIGAFGNDWIRTPHLDSFAKEAVRYTSVFPESLPTLPFRRAIHTGQRVFPFTGHKRLKGDINGSAGWGPIREEQDTVAELLNEAGYRTALITDVYHQFKPSKNFHRGFDEWRWIRGQEGDKYQSGPNVPQGVVESHEPERQIGDPNLGRFLHAYLRNNHYRMTEHDYYPARLFAEASRWVWDNRDAEKFFLVVDSFDPHEPWDPPENYRRMYDADNDCRNVIQSCYTEWRKRYTARELKRVQANYAGEVTMVDRWFGQFWETLQNSGRLDDTAVLVLSDHGHNLGYDPGDKGLVSKQGHPMTNAVARLVAMIRHPAGIGAGSESDLLLSNVDVTATMLDFAGVKAKQTLDGKPFWGAAKGREYVTIGWGPLVTVIDDEWWYNANAWGEGALLYHHRDDPTLERNLAAEKPELCTRMLDRAVADAGGSIPPEFKDYAALPGCTPYWSPG